MDSAVDLLIIFEKELNAIIDDNGWRKGYGLRVAERVLIQLASLQIALDTDGSEIALIRIVGSRREFEDLCEFVCEQFGIATN